MAGLPGGDPLAAALGAGETPSPGMVAAAGDNTPVNRKLALAGLISVAFGLALVAGFQGSDLLQDDTPSTDNPSVLRYETQQILKNELGYSETPADTYDGFRSFPRTMPESVGYWYRQRARGRLFVYHFWNANWGSLSWAQPDFFVPPFTASGELRLILTADKRLRYFRAIPKKQVFVDQQTSEPRWSEWFSPERIGFDLSEREDAADGASVLRRIEDHGWTPPDAYDRIAMWEGRTSDGEIFHVFAAAWRGRPTYFRVIYGELSEGYIPSVYALTRPHDSLWYVFALRLAAAMFGVVLAWRNLRAGRVDRIGGRRLAS